MNLEDFKSIKSVQSNNPPPTLQCLKAQKLPLGSSKGMEEGRGAAWFYLYICYLVPLSGKDQCKLLKCYWLLFENLPPDQDIRVLSLDVLRMDGCN